MKQLTIIVAAVVDTKKAVLYKKDGTTVEILQGDTRLRPILERITPLLATQGWADVDLSTENSFKEFEEQSQGGVRFFRVAKKFLSEMFGTKEGEKPAAAASPLPPGVFGNMPLNDKMQNALQEILKHGESVKADTFTEEKIAQQRPTAMANGQTPNDRTNNGKEEHFDKHEETVVAVTNTGKVIPGVERIKSQFKGAAKSGNTRGMEIFLERIGKIITKRQHSVEDLLRFMERGDLPIADDGTIIIYKKLRRSGERYVDCHTGKVQQRVGSFVCMDEKLVDPNRRNECSNGLHVARRGYISSFSGDVIVLAKVRPEDVIAVPDYDANKMRVRAYHILFELTAPQFKAINSNRPISEAEGGLEVLNAAIAGHHTGIIETVEICAQQGGDVKITAASQTEIKRDIKAVKKKKKAQKKKAKRGVVKKQAKPLEAAVHDSDKPVDVKKIVAKTKDSTRSLDAAEPTKVLTQTDVVKDMYDQAIAGNKAKAQELLTFKKKAKKGWAVWGLPDTTGETLKGLIDG